MLSITVLSFVLFQVLFLPGLIRKVQHGRKDKDLFDKSSRFALGLVYHVKTPINMTAQSSSGLLNTLEGRGIKGSIKEHGQEGKYYEQYWEIWDHIYMKPVLEFWFMHIILVASILLLLPLLVAVLLKKVVISLVLASFHGFLGVVFFIYPFVCMNGQISKFPSNPRIQDSDYLWMLDSNVDFKGTWGFYLALFIYFLIGSALMFFTLIYYREQTKLSMGLQEALSLDSICTPTHASNKPC